MISLRKISRVFVALAFTTTSVFILIPGAPINIAQSSLILLFLILLAFDKLLLHREITFFLAFYLAVSLIIALINGFSFVNIVISYVVLNIYAAVLNSVFHLHKGEFGKLISLYLNVAFFAAIVGVVQEVSFVAHFEPGYNLKWLFNGSAKFTYTGSFLKVPSIFTEPGYFAPFLIPAVYMSLRSLIFGSGEVGKIRAIIILAALVCTFSIIGYLGMLLCLIVIFRKNLVIGVACGALFALYAAYNVASIKSRSDAAWDFLNGDFTINSNFSSLVTILNYHITVESFGTHPVFGAGIDGYEMMSSQVLSRGFSNEVLNKFISMNHPDILMVKEAGNLFFRLLVEFGLVGFLLLGYLMWSKYSKMPDAKHIQWMCLLFLITYSLRTGQYLRFELWFFVMLYLKIGSEAKVQREIETNGSALVSSERID